MPLDRRLFLAAGLGAGVGTGLSAREAGAAGAGSRPGRDGFGQSGHGRNGHGKGASFGGLSPGSDADQTAALQALIDSAARRGAELVLPPGRFRCGTLTLRPGSRITGSGSATVLEAMSTGPLLAGAGADGAALSALTLDGARLAPSDGAKPGLVDLTECGGIDLTQLTIRSAGSHGVRLERSAGRIVATDIRGVAEAAIHALDSLGLTVANNDIADCGNNGIQIWRSRAGEDGTIVTGNRIRHVAARSGGSGQNGNGINVFRAGGVAVTDNTIADCAYSAVRGNAASDIRITSNTCLRLGEVAIYAEFGFEGALIASNLVDGAATGISVTNFDHGGRLAVVQGNLIRNLVRREHEPVDKRGEGITVEADAAVTGNTIDNAPTAGLVIGWGRYMRDCLASGNLIRNTGVGILISSDPEAGSCLVTGNMISGARQGAIRAMNRGTPHGPDLGPSGTETARVRIGGNMITGSLPVL
jgi:uncharacterized secreted repeat protein (TIGR03808 family)